MVELEPVPEEDELLERLHHAGGDIEHKGLVDVMRDMTGHDASRLYQLIANHARYTGSTRARRRSSTTGANTCRSSARSCRSNTAARWPS